MAIIFNEWVYELKVKGFTLIELIAVVAIVAIFSVLCYPSISQLMDINKLDISTNELVSDIRLAKIYAITNSKVSVRVMFVLNQGGGSYGGYKIYYLYKNSNTIYLANRTFDAQIVIDKTKSTFMNGGIGSYLEFNSAGNVNMACSIVLKDLLNNMSRTVTLTIGYTRIEALQ